MTWGAGEQYSLKQKLELTDVAISTTGGTRRQEATDVLGWPTNPDGGDVRYRVLVRNTLEDVLYFKCIG